LRFLRNAVRADDKGAGGLTGELWQDIDKDSELELIETKVEEIEAALKAKGQRAENFVSFEGRLAHLQRRLWRLESFTQDFEQKRQINESGQKVMAMLT
jgi:Mg2+ and Co2+ transporter CorA